MPHTNTHDRPFPLMSKSYFNVIFSSKAESSSVDKPQPIFSFVDKVCNINETGIMLHIKITMKTKETFKPFNKT